MIKDTYCAYLNTVDDQNPNVQILKNAEIGTLARSEFGHLNFNSNAIEHSFGYSYRVLDRVLIRLFCIRNLDICPISERLASKLKPAV